MGNQRNGNDSGESKPPVIAQYLEQHIDQIKMALPRHLNADRMARITLTECRKNPKLFKCSPASLFGAVIQCSQLGLEPGNHMGHAYLLPFWNKRAKCYDVNLIIGYRGMLDLAYRSGKVVAVESVAVFQGDHFAYTKGLQESLTHRRQEPEIYDPDQLTHVYVVVRLKDSDRPMWDVYSRSFIEARRERSQAKDDGPWVTDYVEMARKTGVRALFKYMPISIELQHAVGLDEAADIGLNQGNASIIEGEFTTLPENEGGEDDEPPATRTEQLRNKLNGGQDDSPPPPEPEPEPEGDGPPSEAALFAQLEEVISNPGKYSTDTINELAALSDAISAERKHEFGSKLKQAHAAMKGGEKPAPPPADEGVQSAFYGD